MSHEKRMSAHATIERQLHAYLRFASFVFGTQGSTLAGPGRRLKRQTIDGQVTHGDGLLYKLMLSGDRPVAADQVTAWADDTEHGVFHGLMTGFHAFSERYGNDIPDPEKAHPNREIAAAQRLLLDCLLHDFCRCGNQPDDGHDAWLKHYFDSLSSVVYRHSDPEAAEAKYPLIRGDRIELMRYVDHRDWLWANTLDFVPPERLFRLEVFYSRMRPAMELMWQKRGEVWMRHGLEHGAALLTPELVKQNLWPPVGTNWVPDYMADGYAVEISRLPVQGSMLIEFNKWQPCCIAPMSAARACGCRLRPIRRDHVAASKRLPSGEWVVITDRELKPTVRNVCDLSLIYDHVAGVIDYRTANLAMLVMEQVVMWLRALRDC